jgi:hypothetical protein
VFVATEWVAVKVEHRNRGQQAEDDWERETAPVGITSA